MRRQQGAVLLPRRALGLVGRLVALQVVDLPVDEHHDVGVLLDGPAFPQVRHVRLLVVPPLDPPVDLGKQDDADAQFAGELLQGLGDLENLDILHRVLPMKPRIFGHWPISRARTWP